RRGYAGMLKKKRRPQEREPPFHNPADGQGPKLFLGLFGRNLGRGRLGDQLLCLTHPVVALDLALELQRVVDVGDVFVREVGELLELVAVERLEPRREIGVDALDARQVIGLALGLLEALPGRVEAAGTNVGTLEDAGST